MPAISHKYLEKLRREVEAFEEWLGATKPESDGSASASDLQTAFTKANAIYIKALALYRTTAEEEPDTGGDESAERIMSRG